MEKTEVRNITERANSFCGRYGGTGTDFKLYWDTLDELKTAISAVIDAAIHAQQEQKRLQESAVEEVKNDD